MAQRRPLIAGVNAPDNTDPEAVRAFVSQSPAKENSDAADTHSPAMTQEHTSPNAQRAGRDSVNQQPTRPAKPKRRAKLPVGLIPVTVRLRPEIAGALKRASLERQLAGDDLHTQQDIVEQALEPWLRSEGSL